MSSPNDFPFGHDSADPDFPMPGGKDVSHVHLACQLLLSLLSASVN